MVQAPLGQRVSGRSRTRCAALAARPIGAPGQCGQL